mmetsp:Transcript_360/g.1173  ORF Transcript_360/g.1173 Transcript_360/m.1173 type:complete len:383 (+) Transcript_360:1343-2491(+)
MVRGFVEEEDVRVLQENLAQANPHLPASAEGCHQCISLLRQKAHGVNDLVHLGFEVVGFEAFGVGLQSRHVVQHLLHAVRIRSSLSESLLRFIKAPQDVILLHKDGKEFLLESARRHQVIRKLLPEEGCAQGLGGLDNIPRGCFHLPGEDLHLCRLPATIHTHEADPVSGFHLPARILEHLLVPEDTRNLVEAQGHVTWLGTFRDLHPGSRAILAHTLLQRQSSFRVLLLVGHVFFLPIPRQNWCLRFLLLHLLLGSESCQLGLELCNLGVNLGIGHRHGLLQLHTCSFSGLEARQGGCRWALLVLLLLVLLFLLIAVCANANRLHILAHSFCFLQLLQGRQRRRSGALHLVLLALLTNIGLSRGLVAERSHRRLPTALLIL